MRRDPIVLGDGYILPGDDIGVTRPNGNVLVVGISGCGKSTSVLLPTLARMENGNPVLSFAKEADAYATARYLSSRGYTVRILNVAHPEQSTVSCDPMTSIESYEDIDALAGCIVNGVIRRSSDDYWQAKARRLLTGLIAAAFMLSDVGSFPGMPDVLRLFDRLIPMVDGDGISTQADGQFELLRHADPQCLAVREFDSWHSLPNRTASCVRDTLAAALGTMFPEAVRRMLGERDPLDIPGFAAGKEALILITSAVDPAQQYYANLVFRDLIRRLLRHAAQCPGGELPREIRFLFDDMSCTAPIQGLAHDLSLFRAAGMSAVIFLQSEEQLDAVYKEEAPIIRQNCAAYAYFPGGFDDRSCEIVSKRMGLPYEDILYAPMGKVFIMRTGARPVHIPRYPTLESREYREFLAANLPGNRRGLRNAEAV